MRTWAGNGSGKSKRKVGSRRRETGNRVTGGIR